MALTPQTNDRIIVVVAREATARERQSETLRQQLEALAEARAAVAREASEVRARRMVVTGLLSDLPRHALHRRRTLTHELDHLTTRDAALTNARGELDHQRDTTQQQLGTLEQPTAAAVETAPRRRTQPIPRRGPAPAPTGSATLPRVTGTRREGLTQDEPTRPERHRDSSRDGGRGR